jgi:four helix bundle protein
LGIWAVATGNYRQLLVWRNGMELVRRVYQVTRSFPRHEALGLAAQMQRAAVSIPANIAEGHARGSTKEFVRYVVIAHGSLAELETLLQVAQDLRYLDPATSARFTELCDATGRMLGGLRRKLKAKIATKRSS